MYETNHLERVRGGGVVRFGGDACVFLDLRG